MRVWYIISLFCIYDRLQFQKSSLSWIKSKCSLWIIYFSFALYEYVLVHMIYLRLFSRIKIKIKNWLTHKKFGNFCIRIIYSNHSIYFNFYNKIFYKKSALFCQQRFHPHSYSTRMTYAWTMTCINVKSTLRFFTTI